jgi:hypothetical protein
MSNQATTPKFKKFSQLVDLKEKIKEEAFAYLTDIYKSNVKDCGVDMFDRDAAHHKVVFYRTFEGEEKLSSGLAMIGEDLFHVKHHNKEIEMVCLNWFGGDALIELVYLVEKKFQS